MSRAGRRGADGFPWEPSPPRDPARPSGLIAGSGRRGQPRNLGSSRCPGVPHAGHASTDWTCPIEDGARQRPAVPGTASTDYPEIYQLACQAAVYASIAEEVLNLLDTLDRTPGNRVIVMTRAAEIRRRLAGL